METFDISELITLFLQLFLQEIPLLAIWLGGLVLALARWKRHPRVSALVVTGMVLSLVAAVSGPVLSFWLAPDARNSFDPDRYMFYMRSLSFVLVGLQAAGQMLVLLAVFSGRQPFRRVAPQEQWLPEGRSETRRAAVDLPPNAIRE